MALALTLLAAAAAATAEAPSAPPEAVEAVEVVTRKPIVGDLQAGTSAYRPEYFTPMRPSTAMDMVTWLPGFIFEDTRPMRGLEAATGNVLIDGKPPTSKTDTLQSVLRRIPSSQVERVDIIVGGAPGIDMHGRAVIANVVLKSSAKRQHVVTLTSKVDLHGRSSPEVLMTTSKKDNNRTLEASLNIGRNWALFPGFGYGRRTRYDESGAVIFTSDNSLLVGGPFFIGNASYEFPLASGKLKLSGLGRYYDGHADDIDRLRPGPGRYNLHIDDLYKQGEFGLRYERSFGRMTIETQVLERLTDYSNSSITRRPPTAFDFELDSQESETIGRTVVRFKKDDRLTLEASAEGALNSIGSRSARTVDGVFQVLPLADISADERRGEFAGEVAWKPNGRFSLDASIKIETSDLTARGDANQGRRFTYLKPRAVLGWSPDKQTQLRLRAEREVGQVAFGNFISGIALNTGLVETGNPNILPQQAWIAEAVLERRFWNTGSLTLTARRQELRNVVDPAPFRLATGAVIQLDSNIGDGSETNLIANSTLPLKRLGLGDAILKATVQRDRRRVRDPTDGRLRPLSGQPGVRAELHFTQDFPRRKMNWGVDAFYRGASTLYRPFSTESISGWPRLNVFVEYRPRSDLNLRLEVQNLPGSHGRQTIALYSGLRDRSPLVYRDERGLTVGPLVLFRVRKTLD